MVEFDNSTDSSCTIAMSIGIRVRCICDIAMILSGSKVSCSIGVHHFEFSEDML